MTYLNPNLQESHTVGTAFSRLADKHRITFNGPATGNVLIECSFHRDSISSNAELYIALGDSSDVSLGSTQEHMTNKADEVDDITLIHSFVVTGLTPGNSYTYSILFKAGRGNIKIKYGQGAPPFLVKATVLPETLLT